ncbi:hypothetical protein PGT21_023205 [Puccinia graminis f. sp. tritici]|uniref:Uncharacterized protein n=1 Tax=Puccinia graminis f. sp. tritici TaxID=56615 RepID=A0A5B0QWV8_PUCGR|nr:hypothetical protein PGT21_023205 [Puccinia graminis f. sp. tritici]
MDAYATTILDTQESVLQQNIHPQVGCSSLPANGIDFFLLCKLRDGEIGFWPVVL